MSTKANTPTDAQIQATRSAKEDSAKESQAILDPSLIDHKPVWWHGRVEFTIHALHDLPSTDLFGKTDPYITVHLGKSKLIRTEKKKKTKNPVYDLSYSRYVCHRAASLLFKIKDQDASSSELVAVFNLPSKEALTGQVINGRFPLVFSTSNDKESTIEITFQFFDANCETQCIPLPRAYFQERGCNKVTLFHDAHVPEIEAEARNITLQDGTIYHDASLWNTIYQKIVDAKHFIYITGWSVLTDIHLRRDEEGVPTLGEMLIKKAEEGVQVYMMVWDEAMSTTSKITGKSNKGMMATSDEETYKFFKHTKVNCVKVARDGGDKNKNFFKRVLISSAMEYSFTHHQKLVVVDNGEENEATVKISAFVGGIDLCDGRFDTPEHRIFRGLGTSFPEYDFHNPNAGDGSINSKTGCRQPWHDIHGFIEGPTAIDVLENFNERWKKQGHKNKLLQKLKEHGHHANELTARELFGAGEEGSPNTDFTEKDSADEWGVQIFRSIDDFVADFERSTDTLNKSMGRLIDDSIHQAYVHGIRRAKNFIYIENQYFLGSSHEWEKNQNSFSDHLIPLEIARKVCSKIEAGEDFAVYIVIPMWPEGVPTDMAIQEILLWQSHSIGLMYKMIAKAIQDKGLTGVTPQRYLNIFCPAKRESLDGNTSSESPAAGTYAEKLSKSRRFMIYVHSKMIIIDDEYIIIGSANINNRSMAGVRDSEICFGARQFQHMASLGENPRGNVHGFRLSLWGEHLDELEDIFNTPQSSACVARVREITDKNWKDYNAELAIDINSHLLTYPYQISNDGILSAIPGQEKFPDTDADVVGSASVVIPDLITT